MPLPAPLHNAIFVATQHRLAGTALAEYLRRRLRAETRWCELGEIPATSVVVLLAAHESTEMIPRLLTELSRRGGRVVFVYDGNKPHDDLLEIAERFDVWSSCDIRDDRQVLVDQVEAARGGRAWGQDRLTERWSKMLSQDSKHLSKRELLIAQLFCSQDGPASSDIASDLGISVSTVQTHLANIRRKLAGRYTGNRDALRAALIDRGWLE